MAKEVTLAIIFALIFGVASQSQLRIARACEGSELKIVCNGQDTIEVVRANYGRTLPGVCPGAYDTNTKCHNQKKSLEVVLGSCSDKSSCVIQASNGVFGDPCVGTYKYLEVHYHCKPQVHMARACENSDLKIDCNGHGTIEIVSANYGRTLSGVCPGAQDTNKNCNNQKISVEIVNKSCATKTSCVVHASNGVFGDPCVGTYKYLEVQYRCRRHDVYYA
ncbi:L-rhamnose-binding lectin CSL3 [Hydra vulgaris]|uniref:L-rhamnose-binding lectin CSL3 n=1 Tax=Hydra vulgaris TaxID=6087 RepID=UPI001F5E9C8D|nr:L-rhamnose-binding lectin CSL3-like [Hydra vulgaris]